MDYGHALEFGAFITPTSADPHAPVLLAQAAEAAEAAAGAGRELVARERGGAA